MKKIILSLSVIAAVAAVVVGATTAFFSDTETSTGNTFTAGSIDLKVDSHATYNGELVSSGTWSETDLGVGHRFFDYSDLKPGDEGENTISLHVYDNDAWGLFTVLNLIEDDVSCTEPEEEVDGCSEEGQLGENLLFTAWLDQGLIPGFQNVYKNAAGEYVNDPTIDPEEGDNLMNSRYEIPFWEGELASEDSWKIADVLSAAYAFTPGPNPDGHNDYGASHGLAEDGRMVGSTTYYFGFAWEIPENVGNDVQTDSMSATMEFQVEQHRNNPDPFDI